MELTIPWKHKPASGLKWNLKIWVPNENTQESHFILNGSNHGQDATQLFVISLGQIGERWRTDQPISFTATKTLRVLVATHPTLECCRTRCLIMEKHCVCSIDRKMQRYEKRNSSISVNCFPPGSIPTPYFPLFTALSLAYILLAQRLY